MIQCYNHCPADAFSVLRQQRGVNKQRNKEVPAKGDGWKPTLRKRLTAMKEFLVTLYVTPLSDLSDWILNIRSRTSNLIDLMLVIWS